MGRSILNVDNNSSGQDYYTGDKELELVLKYDSVSFLVFHNSTNTYTHFINTVVSVLTIAYSL